MWAVAVALLKNKKKRNTNCSHPKRSEVMCTRWRRLRGARRGHVLPHFYKWLGTGGTVSRRTANKKLTKLY